MFGVLGHPLDVPLENKLGDFGGEESLAGAERVNSGDEITHRVALQHVTKGARIEHLLNHLRRVMHRKYQNLSTAAAVDDLAGRVESVEPGHADVQQRDVRVEQANFLDGFLSVTGFADHRPAKLRLEKITQTEPNNFVVVCQEQA